MYKLMIVDDEQSIRNGMANGIPWNDWGFEVIALASDGIEALDLIKQNKPDVVISDIKMPKMGGVELMQKLKKEYPEIKMIILSGYNDFEYLNMAIKNSVVEYLLKPTDIDEFEECFKRIKKEIDDERCRIHEIEKNRVYYLDNVLNIYLLGYMDDEIAETDKMMIKDFGIDVLNSAIAMVRVEWNDDVHDEGKLFKKSSNLKDLCNKCTSNTNNICHFFLSQTNRVVAIISSLKHDIDYDSIVSDLQSVLDNLTEQIDGRIYISVGMITDEDNLVSNSYEQALSVAHQRLNNNESAISIYKDNKKRETKYKTISFDYKIINESIMKNNRRKIYAEIDRVFEILSKIDDYQYVARVCLELLFYLSRWSLKYNIDFELIMNKLNIGYEDIRKVVGIEKRKNIIIKILDTLCDYINEHLQSDTKNNTLAKTIKDYIDKEYMKNYMSLEYISGKVKKSATYVSKIFKDEYGQNFSEYITQKRIEKSKELLENPSIKIYEIADMMGYADVSNFIKVFKKVYGMSPGDYRNFVQR